MPIHKPSSANSPIEKIRILTEKKDLMGLYRQLHDEYEIAEFGKYQDRISYDISSAINTTPDSFVAVAYDGKDRVLGVDTGFITHEDDLTMHAHIGWIVRKQSDEFRGHGIGLNLIHASNNFLRERGVASVFTTAAGKLGRLMIEKSGGRKLAPHECQHFNKSLPEYVWHLTEESAVKLPRNLD